MRELGIREWTAIAALCFGVLVAFVFLNPASGETGPRRPIERGDPPPTATPTPPDPPSLLPTPAGWNISFAALRDGEEIVDAQRVIPELDLQFDGVPFPDYRDDSWKVIALAQVELGAGSSQFTLHYDCDIRVFLNDSEVASQANPATPEDLVVTVDHEPGKYTIRIEATDTSGPFTLQYR